MDWSGAAETDLIQAACLLVHDVLNGLAIHHVFMGGYQLVLLGAPRKSRDVDVEVCVSGGRSSYERIVHALKARQDMLVFDGAQDQNVRGMWKGCVGIDVLIREGKSPTEVFPVRFNDTGNKSSAIVPFMPLTSLLVEKVKCASLRFKWADVHDITFLVSEDYNTQLQLESKGLDVLGGCRAISHVTYEAASRRHPAIAGLLYRMMQIKDSVHPGIHGLGCSVADAEGAVRSMGGSRTTLCSVESLESSLSSSVSTSRYTGSLASLSVLSTDADPIETLLPEGSIYGAPSFLSSHNSSRNSSQSSLFSSSSRRSSVATSFGTDRPSLGQCSWPPAPASFRNMMTESTDSA